MMPGAARVAAPPSWRLFMSRCLWRRSLIVVLSVGAATINSLQAGRVKRRTPGVGEAG